MTDPNAASFDAFLQGWLLRQRSFLEELVSAAQRRETRDEERRELINRVLCHYEQYFEEKSRIAQHNILLIFSPPWFSSLERTFLWVAGFKPGLAFQVVDDSVEDLSEDQRQSLSELSHETKIKERQINDEMAKIQESVAAPPILNTARRHGRACLTRSFAAAAEEAVEEGDVPIGLKVALENAVASADALRTSTALRIFQILRQDQVIRFFAAVAELQLRIRSWGFDKDAHGGGGEEGAGGGQ